MPSEETEKTFRVAGRDNHSFEVMADSPEEAAAIALSQGLNPLNDQQEGSYVTVTSEYREETVNLD